MSNLCQRLCVFRIVIDSKFFLSLPSSQLPFWWRGRAQTWDASLKNHSSPLLALQMEKKCFYREREGEKKPSPLEINRMGNKNAQQLSTQCLSTVHIPFAFLRILFHIMMKQTRGAKDRSVWFVFLFLFSIVSHVSAVTQYVTVVPTLSLGLSGSGDSKLGWINLGVKNIVPAIFPRMLILLNFESALCF